MNTRKQYAALPFVCLADRVEVCLITSRATGRWIIPKGWPQDGLAPHDLAALEAYEEAGLKGRTSSVSIGRFRYLKQLQNGSSVRCDVAVYPMQVDYQTLDWPERTQRRLLWVKRKKAVKLVGDPELSSLLRRFDPRAAPLLKTA